MVHVDRPSGHFAFFDKIVSCLLLPPFFDSGIERWYEDRAAKTRSFVAALGEEGLVVLPSHPFLSREPGGSEAPVNTSGASD